MDNTTVKKVHIIYKTHLDVGFTDLSANIFRKYDEKFIPKALATAEALNTPEKTQFIWTVGSFVIDRYLETAPAPEREKLEEAIRRGWITWHGLPFTTHTELMDDSLFRYGLSISRRLDERFGKKTIAAKMSDVPGHTIALVPLLREAGMTYLHIGINSSSKVVDVPQLFRWKLGDDEIIVNYAAWYGETTAVEGLDEVMVFLHSHDNEGPPAPEEVTVFIEKMQKDYPNAEIVGSTLDAFAAVLEGAKDRLPVVTNEIGDTWIHGGATDPKKVGAFERLLALRRKWEKEMPTGYAEARDAFSKSLLLVPEHTWGMDTKKYLYDYRNWSKADFRAARKRDKITMEDLLPAGERTRETVIREATEHAGGLIGSYSLFERSHDEQRAYVRNAVDALPILLRREAIAVVRQDCTVPEPQGGTVAAGDKITLGAHTLTLRADGAVELENGAVIGLFCYQVFDSETTERCYHGYNRCLERTIGWSRPDFAKPGLENVPGLRQEDFLPTVESAATDGDSLTVKLHIDERASELYGCPRRLALRYTAQENEVRVTLLWQDKDASRIPEAIWLGVLPGGQISMRDISLRKLGSEICPADIRPGGNHYLHGAQSVRMGEMTLECPDAPVVSVGGRHLYDVDDSYGDPNEGIEFLVYNNRWGTNFNMWYEDDGRIELTVKI